MKSGRFSKIFVLGFLTLIFSSLTLPIIKYLFDLIGQILFIWQYQFFYQFQINLFLLLFKEILPYLILSWLIFDIFICPGIIKAGLSKRFKIFIYSHILKRKLDHFELNVIKLKTKIKQIKEKGDTNEINNDHLTPKIEKVRFNFYQKRIRSNNKYPIFNNSHFYRKILNKFKSLISFFSIIFYILILDIPSLWRGE